MPVGQVLNSKESQMSNIFNALEQARRERHKGDISSPCKVGVPDKNASIGSGAFSDTSTDSEILNMFTIIQDKLDEDRWVMQLVSAQIGEGVSFVAKRFARVYAELLNKKVLLVKLITRAAEADREFFKEWQEVAKRVEERNSGKSGHSCGDFVEVSMPFNSCFKQFKQDSNSIYDIKRCCDLIIFDTPSTAIEPNSAEFARYVDAVLIVLEAERTKVFAVQSLKDKIKHTSGAFLGVVLNKRCFHIPYSLYSKLH